MVLARFGCHRSPFGSFPRVGKNAPHISRCAKEPCTCKRSQRPTTSRATRAAHWCRPAASGQQAQHLKSFQAAPARKQLASRSMRFRPQAKRRGARGQPWCCLRLAAPGRPLVLSREWERTPRTFANVQRNPVPLRRESPPPARTSGKGHAFRRKAPHCPRHGQKLPPAAPRRGPPQGGAGGTESPLPPCIFRAIVL